ncbi:MAG: starch-binding outer membrane protein SusD/RagB family, partial [Bacteroidota bacterium]|nr:starch-binding outer membrane protein SusD/RagB family [Bacteroidota bacterium]
DKGSSIGMFGPYVVKKFWPLGVNTFDKLWTNYRWVTPHMRLADVYLIYAEAANEAYGADGKAPGANLTAVDAINKVRNRANMPDVYATAAGYSNFRELVQNERSVELCFEGNYWFDLRRWHLAHLDINKQSVDLAFDKNWTKFDRAPIMTRVFDNPKHYWLPIYREQTQLYKDFYQNPGW